MPNEQLRRQDAAVQLDDGRHVRDLDDTELSAVVDACHERQREGRQGVALEPAQRRRLMALWGAAVRERRRRRGG